MTLTPQDQQDIVAAHNVYRSDPAINTPPYNGQAIWLLVLRAGQITWHPRAHLSTVERRELEKILRRDRQEALLQRKWSISGGTPPSTEALNNRTSNRVRSLIPPIQGTGRMLATIPRLFGERPQALDVGSPVMARMTIWCVNTVRPET